MKDMAFAGNLVRLMRLRNKTRVLLAEECGCTPNAAGAWTRGTIPRPDMLQRIAVSLGVTEAALLDGVGKTTAAPETVPEIVEDARIRIAAAMGVKPEKVRLTLVYEA